MGSQVYEKTSLEKWKRAVVHLHCFTDDITATERGQDSLDLLRQKNAGKISFKEFLIQHAELKGDSSSYVGTAIFMEHESKRYLLTARHVIYNEEYALNEYKAKVKERDEIREKNPRLHGLSDEALQKQRDNTVFEEIFSVPSIEEILQPIVKRIYPLHMRGVTEHKCTLSTPDIDLGVIYLDDVGEKYSFSDQLLERGYVPISLDDIAAEPTSEGVEVFTVGYPANIANLGKRDISEALASFESTLYSTPIFSFGRVAMLNDNLESFWADITIYPGNSGGPVVQDDRLVGIVSGQPALELEGIEDPGTYRIPFGRMIKAKHLLDLIYIQMAKQMT